MTLTGTNRETTIIKSLDPHKIRKDFPILKKKVHGRDLIYLDNAATTQKPAVVIQALENYYRNYNANIHRGIHALAERATDDFESTRKKILEYIHAGTEEEIIFTYGTTDGINLVTNTFGREFLKKGDEVIISEMEHHSNIVPWQIICKEKEAALKVIPVDDRGQLIMEEYLRLLNENTRIVSIGHVSNALGTINPVKEIIRHAHAWNAKVLIDGAQAAANLNIDVKDLDCDFYVFSAHKMLGPTGVGVLYGKKEILEEMPPYRGGGEMISEVTFEKTTYNNLPYKFEAGTPNIADVIGFKEAINYISGFEKQRITEYEQDLLEYTVRKLSGIEELEFIGTANEKLSIVSFNLEGIHPFDVGMMLDVNGIAVRTGHHCTQPLMKRFGIEGTVRASFSFYNTYEEVDALTEALQKLIRKRKR